MAVERGVISSAISLLVRQVSRVLAVVSSCPREWVDMAWRISGARIEDALAHRVVDAVLVRVALVAHRDRLGDEHQRPVAAVRRGPLDRWL